ncbi:MAG: phage GP46 family protein [Burkholderiales bacterium]|nr:phage GP46 family protein [Burkholderiales bacterium]
MSDLRTLFVSFEAGADLALEGFALATDDGLETAVILSLFTDARAADDDALPAGSTERRGAWIDSYPVVDGDKFGSRLWLLQREKQTQDTLNRAKEYAEEALGWMISDGVASRVDVAAFIVRMGVLGLSIAIHRPDVSVTRYRYENLWNNA